MTIISFLFLTTFYSFAEDVTVTTDKIPFQAEYNNPRVIDLVPISSTFDKKGEAGDFIKTEYRNQAGYVHKSFTNLKPEIITYSNSNTSYDEGDHNTEASSNTFSGNNTSYNSGSYKVDSSSNTSDLVATGKTETVPNGILREFRSKSTGIISLIYIPNNGSKGKPATLFLSGDGEKGSDI